LKKESSLWIEDGKSAMRIILFNMIQNATSVIWSAKLIYAF